MKQIRKNFLAVMLCMMTACASSSHPVTDIPLNRQTLADSSPFWQADPHQLWGRLQSLPPAGLQQAAQATHNDTAREWLELARISKQYQHDSTRQLSALAAWQARYPEHPGNQLLPPAGSLSGLQQENPPHHIALLLPLQGADARSGNLVQRGFMDAWYRWRKAHPGLHTTLSFLDTAGGSTPAALYRQAISQGADYVVGPLTRADVLALSREGTLSVPVLALNYLPDSSLFSPPFVQYGLAPEDEALQLAAQARAAGYDRALLIAPADAFGKRLSRVLIPAWKALGGHVQDSLFFTPGKPLDQDVARFLKTVSVPQPSAPDTPLPRRRQDADVILLLAASRDAKQIVPLLKYNFAGDLPILSTSAIYSESSPTLDNMDLNGVIFCDAPAILSGKPRLYAVGQDAWLLASQTARLRALPDFPLYGMTGAMTLQSGQRIFRRLPWITMQNGHPRPTNWQQG